MQQHTSTPGPAPTWEAPRVVDGSDHMLLVVILFGFALALAFLIPVALGRPSRYWTQEKIDETTR